MRGIWNMFFPKKAKYSGVNNPFVISACFTKKYLEAAATKKILCEV